MTLHPQAIITLTQQHTPSNVVSDQEVAVTPKSKQPVGRPEKDESEKRDKLRVTVPMNEGEKAEIAAALKALTAEYGMEVKEAVWGRKVLLEAARAVVARKKK
jgi:undecaprenyl pyrophosphate synthase